MKSESKMCRNDIGTFGNFFHEHFKALNKKTKCDLTPYQKAVLDWTEDKNLCIIKTQRMCGMSSLMRVYIIYKILNGDWKHVCYYADKYGTVSNEKDFMVEILNEVSDVSVEDGGFSLVIKDKNKQKKIGDITFKPYDTENKGSYYDALMIANAAFTTNPIHKEEFEALKSKATKIYMWSTPTTYEASLFGNLCKEGDENTVCGIKLDDKSYGMMYDGDYGQWKQSLRGFMDAISYTNEVDGEFYEIKEGTMKANSSTTELPVFSETEQTTKEAPKFVSTSSDKCTCGDTEYYKKKKTELTDDIKKITDVDRCNELMKICTDDYVKSKWNELDNLGIPTCKCEDKPKEVKCKNVRVTKDLYLVTYEVCETCDTDFEDYVVADNIFDAMDGLKNSIVAKTRKIKEIKLISGSVGVF